MENPNLVDVTCYDLVGGEGEATRWDADIA